MEEVSSNSQFSSGETLADYLVFIDTNILLDFYRVRGRESGLSMLGHIQANLPSFIVTNQVEMEFKKHRQRVILDSHSQFKLPDMGGLQLPAFLAESKHSGALSRNQKELKRLSALLKSRMSKVLEQPTKQDPVYEAAQRLFRVTSTWNLGRDKKERLRIRHLARKRFVLGYPPRKDSDSSIGDAINWEWIIHCASKSGKNVVIVSRDSDYGITFNSEPVINDWLLQEFRERVSRRRKILLTDRLTTGLRAARITVTRKEEESEDNFLKERPTVSEATALESAQAAFHKSWEELIASHQQPALLLQEALEKYTANVLASLRAASSRPIANDKEKE